MGSSYMRDNDPTAPAAEDVSLEDLTALDLDRVLLDAPLTNLRTVERSLWTAVKACEETGDFKVARAYQLLGQLSFIRMRVDEPEPFGEAAVRDEFRSPIPSDYAGVQNDILAEFIPHITHLGLKARVADIIAYNDRSKGEAIKTAISTYATIIVSEIERLDALPRTNIEGNAFDLITLATRALQLVRLSSRRGAVPEHIASAVTSLYDRAKRRKDIVAFHQIAEVTGQFKVVGWQTIAEDLETVGVNADQTYHMALWNLWSFAGEAYDRAKDNDGKRRCWDRSVDAQLLARDANGSKVAKAHLTQKALLYARSRGLRHRYADLLAQLRGWQAESVDEYSTMSIPVDLAPMRDLVQTEFKDLSLSRALLKLATLSSVPTLDEIRASADQARETGFFSGMFGTIQNDARGRQVAIATPAETDCTEGSPWFQAQAAKYFKMNGQTVVQGFIEPARREVQDIYSLEGKHFHVIALKSPFVPTGFEHIFAMGLARFWQGDYVTAAYLLIPQLENAMRNYLAWRGVEAAKIHDDGNQEDRGLTVLLGELRADTETVFGKNLTYSIEMLFHNRQGPALRHQLAHGKLTTGACYDDQSIYACWLIYKMVCMPLVTCWDTEITPDLEPGMVVFP